MALLPTLYRKESPLEDQMGLHADIQRLLRLCEGDGLTQQFEKLFRYEVDPKLWDMTTREFLVRIDERCNSSQSLFSNAQGSCHAAMPANGTDAAPHFAAPWRVTLALLTCARMYNGIRQAIVSRGLRPRRLHPVACTAQTSHSGLKFIATPLMQ